MGTLDHKKRREFEWGILLVLSVLTFFLVLDPVRFFKSIGFLFTISKEYPVVRQTFDMPDGGVLVSSVKRLDDWRESSYHYSFTYRRRGSPVDEVFGSELVKRSVPIRKPIVFANGATVVVAVTNWAEADVFYVRQPRGQWQKYCLDVTFLTSLAVEDNRRRLPPGLTGRICGCDTNTYTLSVIYGPDKIRHTYHVSEDGKILVKE